MPRRLPLARVALVLSALLAPASTAAAQGGQIGLVGGATFASLRGLDAVSDLESRTGLIGGGYLLLPLPGRLQLQLEGLLVNEGANAVGAGEEDLELSYAQVPVLLRFNLGSGFINPHLYAGPYLGLRVRCTVGERTACDDAPDVVSTSTVDVGGVAGGGLSLGLGGLVATAGARYGFGVSTLAEFDAAAARAAVKHGGWALYAGLGLRFGGR